MDPRSRTFGRIARSIDSDSSSHVDSTMLEHRRDILLRVQVQVYVPCESVKAPFTDGTPDSERTERCSAKASEDSAPSNSYPVLAHTVGLKQAIVDVPWSPWWSGNGVHAPSSGDASSPSSALHAEIRRSCPRTPISGMRQRDEGAWVPWRRAYGCTSPSAAIILL
jgi:hypothetical protein